MKKLFILLAAWGLAACATNSSGIAPLGDGQYMLHGTDLTGWRDGESVKAELLREAANFCSQKGQELTAVRYTSSDAGWIDFAKAGIRFRCKPSS